VTRMVLGEGSSLPGPFNVLHQGLSKNLSIIVQQDKIY